MPLPPVRRRAAVFAAVVALAGAALALPAAAETTSHAIAEFGEPKYGPDFTHFDYVDPDAPKGGSVVLTGARQSFDSLNPIPLRGEYAVNIGLAGMSLMTESQDEVGVYYGALAESATWADDLSSITFALNPQARFADGEPVTADDVVWSFEQVREHGRPFLQAFFDDVTAATAIDDRQVRFDFATTGRMQPLTRVAGILPIEPRHWWEAEESRDIAGGNLEPPPWPGPYRIVDVDPGRRIVYERKDGWWGADLPAYRGQFNFDRIEYDYYRDRDVAFEAFAAGEYDYRREFSSRIWARAYDFDAANDGRVRRREVEEIDYQGMYGYFMNTRRPPFDDVRARRALTYLYPFEWVQANVMYGAYTRVDSYFPGSEYAATGLPEGEELAVLEGYRDSLPESVFTEPFALPENPQSRVSRENRRAALRLLAEAGYEIRDGTLVDVETGDPVEFTILMRSAQLEPHTQAWARNLEQVGIDARLRLVDSAQYQALLDDFDYDVTMVAFTFFPPPGPELRNRFACATAGQPGSANLLGVCDPVVDDLADRIVESEALETKQVLTRALDRVLLSGWYVVPAWYNEVAWIAHWDKFAWPDHDLPLRDFGLPNSVGFQPSWWVDPDKAAALEAAR
ncbi:MAG: extracellular solute-binding protein [Azospirillaceae bacterium]